MTLSDVAKLHLVENTDDAMACLRWLSEQKDIGLDTEGTGLSPEVDRVRMVQIGSETEGFAIPFEINQMLVEDIVKRFEGTYWTHNGPYDDAMLRRHGVKLPRHKVHNTLLMAHCLSSTGPLGLKPLYSRHIDSRGADLQDDLQNVFHETGWNWTTIPWQHKAYWMYGALDPCLTLQLGRSLLPQVQAVCPASYELERAVSWPVADMERHGVLIDRPYVQGLATELEQRIAELSGEIASRWSIAPGSNVQLASRLLSEGIELTKLTGSGKDYSMDKEVLAGIDHPLAAAVLDYRGNSKMLGTYLTSYLELSARDGRIHPSINTVGGRAKNPFEPGGKDGVRTGRMSGSDPNLQNVPKRNERATPVRRSFTVAEDHVWITADADQIEMRAMAHVCQDPGLRAAFLSGEDFFVAMGKEVHQDQNFVKSDPRRQLIKNGMYAKIYGATPPKFAHTANMRRPDGGLDVAGAAKFLNRINEMYPGLPRFDKAVKARAMQRLRSDGVAYVQSPLTGRRMTADRGREYALGNYCIQGYAAELLKTKILQLDAAGLGPYMILPVHDEINLEVPKDETAEVMATMKEILNDDTILSVPLTWGIESGPNWGECK